MILAACATEFEMLALLDHLDIHQGKCLILVTGVGVVETTLQLTRYFEQHPGQVDRVVHFGIGGAYLSQKAEGIALLDVCLAGQEVLGDFGVCYPDRIEPLSKELVHKKSYLLDTKMLQEAQSFFSEKNLDVHCGNFVTVCGVNASKRRGDMFAEQYDAICENMEGGAMARVCAEYQIPLFELRAISNFVEDRDLSNWNLSGSCRIAGKAASQFILHLLDQKG